MGRLRKFCWYHFAESQGLIFHRFLSGHYPHSSLLTDDVLPLVTSMLQSNYRYFVLIAERDDQSQVCMPMQPIHITK